MATAEVHELNTYIPVLDTHYPTFTSRHDYKTIHIKDRFDSRDTSKQFDRSVEGQASKVWSKLPQDILQKGQVDGWQSITKDCQRFLTGKPTKQKTKKKNKIISRPTNWISLRYLHLQVTAKVWTTNWMSSWILIPLWLNSDLMGFISNKTLSKP